MRNLWKSTDCLVCGSNENSVLFPGREDGLHGNLEAYFSSSRLKAVHGPIVRCTQCGFVYANPQPSQVELGRIYRGLMDSNYASEEPARFATARRMLDVVEKWQTQRGMLLDVGCSTGLFLQYAQQRGWRSLGLEPSSWTLTECCRRGVSAYQGNVESIALSAEAFDVVTMWDVLEHSFDPLRALGNVHHTLKQGGLLFIDVPNIESKTARLTKQRWPLLLLEHLWYFSPTTLGRLLEKNGFQLLAILPHQVTFSLGFILTRLIQQGVFSCVLTNMVESSTLLRRLPVSFTMGEMTAIARKV